jgi:hypothetical protein
VQHHHIYCVFFVLSLLQITEWRPQMVTGPLMMTITKISGNGHVTMGVDAGEATTDSPSRLSC